jgi:hypothetical protein
VRCRVGQHTVLTPHLVVTRHSPVESNQITHGADGEVGHEVHVFGVNEVNEVLPFLDCAVVRIENGEVERGVT